MSSPGRYTHGHHESVLRSHRWRTAQNSAAYLMGHLAPGQHLLDVGCGPGTVTADLARLVAPGEVTGIDASPEVVELAAGQSDLPANVHFAPGDVYHLAFADHCFEVVHAHQVLQHLTDPVAALAEMGRVCAPGGVVAARDADFGSWVHYPEDPLLVRWVDLYTSAARSNGGEPHAGRHLAMWAMAAGFPRVETFASTWCFATEEERRWWGALWADRITQSAVAEQVRRMGLADPEELELIADAWRRWAENPSGWFAMIHGEVLCWV